MRKSGHTLRRGRPGAFSRGGGSDPSQDLSLSLLTVASCIYAIFVAKSTSVPGAGGLSQFRNGLVHPFQREPICVNGKVKVGDNVSVDDQETLGCDWLLSSAASTLCFVRLGRTILAGPWRVR